MNVRFAGNVALNTRADLNPQVADFYRSLGLEAREMAPDFHSVGPAPYACYVVSWEPAPQAAGEVCLQLKADDLEEVTKRVQSGQGEVLYFGDDPYSPQSRHLWFRDPAGNLINVVESRGTDHHAEE